MIASRVLSEKELKDKLGGLGYQETTHKSSTSTFWQRNEDRHVVQVPTSIDGFYPDWLIEKLEEAIGVKLTHVS